MTWQPIETAPKDGKDYLFYTPQYGGRQVVTYLYPDGQMGHKHFVEQFTRWKLLDPHPEEANHEVR